MIKTIIYIAVNSVNGKRYIGITSRDLGKRAREHFSSAKRNEHNGSFHRAIRKYGFYSFTFEVLEVCETKQAAKQREIELIAELHPEYNSTLGGDGRLGGGFTNDGLRRISEFHKGKKWQLGKNHKQETKDRLREIGLQNIEKWKEYSHLGPMASRKPVVCLNTGKIYESAVAAAAANSVSSSMIVELCLRNKRRKAAKNLVFRYFGDHYGGLAEVEKVLAERDVNRKRYPKSLTKPIICVTYGIKFSSATAASEEYCISRQSISEVCNGGSKSVYGLTFKYIEDLPL